MSIEQVKLMTAFYAISDNGTANIRCVSRFVTERKALPAHHR